MAIFAVINNGIVINNILAESKKIAEEITGLVCVENNSNIGGIGDTWDGTTFIKPYIDPEVLNKSDIVIE